MKKAISLIASFLCALSCLTMAGCGKKKTTEVYFLNFKPESATVYEDLAKKYEEEKGVKVKVVTAAANGYEQTLKSEIAKPTHLRFSRSTDLSAMIPGKTTALI